jgi:hypothetical protein
MAADCYRRQLQLNSSEGERLPEEDLDAAFALHPVPPVSTPSCTPDSLVPYIRVLLDAWISIDEN